MSHIFLEQIEQEIEHIKSSSYSFDINIYIQNRLPLHFPNKGITALSTDGKIYKRKPVIEVHHEALDFYQSIKSIDFRNLESLIDFYGTGHQRDYCYVVIGHRFDDSQKIQFRGVLGFNRLYKIILMLRLAGIERSRIQLINHNPDYKKLVRNDLRPITGVIHHVVIGGEGALGPFLSTNFKLVQYYSGKIISFKQYKLGSKNVIFTNYPYGDLCNSVVEGFARKTTTSIIFVGGASALSEKLRIGAIVAPHNIHDEYGNAINKKFENIFSKQGPKGVQAVELHGNVKTPLRETENFVRKVRKLGWETLDVEVAHFQRACEDWLRLGCRCGVLLYIVDKPKSKRTIAMHDYSDPSIVKIRQRLAKFIEHWMEVT